MRREDLEKLMGGYAAGTLTDEERRALFEAAVSDQALFDALAMEEPLRDTLADPAARARVLEALAESRPSRFGRVTEWLGRPQVWALGASAAGVVVLALVVLRFGTAPRPPAQPQVAMARLEKAAPAPASPPVRREASAAPQRIPKLPANTAIPRQFDAPGAAMAAPEALPSADSTISDALVAGQALPQEPKGLAAEASPATSHFAQAPATPVPAPPPPPPAVPSVSENVDVRMQAATAGFETDQVSARSLYVANRMPAAQSRARADLGLAAKKKDREAGGFVAGLGLRYTLQRRGLDGKYFDVPVDTELDPAEKARLSFEVNEAAYLYVFSDTGEVFRGAVRAWRPVTVDAQPGAIHVVLSREPDSGPIATLDMRTRAQLADVKLAVDAPTGLRPHDESVYVVNPNGAPDARVMAEVRLRFR